MLRSFLPVFAMTFMIVLFIVLMQFLWRYIDDMVGKGLGIDVLAELFFYAALTMVPLALPLAILLASLMTFGNLGEQFELTAMKASGISLIRVMKPLTVLIALVAIGAFFFQNNLLPVAQTKMWTLLFSMRQKSPEVEIPERVFYDQIPNINLYVEHKDRETGMLYGVKIYEMSKGFDQSRVLLADSGSIASTDDNRHLFVRLWNGEQYDNFSEGGFNMRNNPFKREIFEQKDILIPFDANFTRINEEGMRNQYIGKNISELQATIDSVNQRVDSLGRIYGRDIINQPRMGIGMASVPRPGANVRGPSAASSTGVSPITVSHPLDVDSVFRGRSSGSTAGYLNIALSRAKSYRQDYEYRSITMKDDRKTIRRHAIEMQKKFTLSFACLIFFFIGAPLGAIIRKGGLGTPLVISVLLFIVYYIIDNTGYKLARDGKMEVWQGIWLSSAVLLPLGIFLTYKAVNDSAVFNPDAYRNFFRRLIGTHESRNIAMKEVVIHDVDTLQATAMLEGLRTEAADFIARVSSDFTYRHYLTYGINREALRHLEATLEATVEYLSNSRDILLLNKMMDYPVLRNLWIYRPSRARWLSLTMIWCFPLGFILYLVGRRAKKHLLDEARTIERVSTELLKIISESSEASEPFDLSDQSDQSGQSDQSNQSDLSDLSDSTDSTDSSDRPYPTEP